jgi:hypothetical protein
MCRHRRIVRGTLATIAVAVSAVAASLIVGPLPGADPTGSKSADVQELALGRELFLREWLANDPRSQGSVPSSTTARASPATTRAAPVAADRPVRMSISFRRFRETTRRKQKLKGQRPSGDSFGILSGSHWDCQSFRAM